MLVYAVNASRAALVRSAITIFFVAVPVMAIGIFAGADRLLGQAAHQARLEDLDNVEKLGGRTLFWDNVVGVLLENPVFGQGIGLRTRESGISSSTHNAFLEAWVGAGIFGALLFTLGIVSTGARLISTIRWSRTRLSAERDNSYRVATTALAVLVYLAVHVLT
jgi:O-antigen ligase